MPLIFFIFLSSQVVVEVFVSNRQSFLQLNAESVKNVTLETLALENRRYDEVSVFFVDRDGICRLHAQYFNDPTPTDCISFPIDEETEEGYKVLGDIFICPETAHEFLSQQKNDFSLTDVYIETTLYLVHGLLHLLGYDDLQESDRIVMREAEQRIMQHLAQKNLFLHS